MQLLVMCNAHACMALGMECHLRPCNNILGVLLMKLAQCSTSQLAPCSGPGPWRCRTPRTLPGWRPGPVPGRCRAGVRSGPSGPLGGWDLELESGRTELLL